MDPTSHGVGQPAEPVDDDLFVAGVNAPIGQDKCKNTSPWHGINSTPVILTNGASGLVLVAYLAKDTKHPNPDPSNNYSQGYFLMALDLQSGAPFWDNPLALTGDYSIGGNPPLTFLPYMHTQRAALTIYVPPNPMAAVVWVLVPFSSRCDYFGHQDEDWQGWILAADINSGDVGALFASSLSPTGNNGCGGIWATAGLSIDDPGSIYAVTGNGVFDGDTKFGCSIVKLGGSSETSSGIGVVAHYTPTDWNDLFGSDEDLGGSSAVLLPPQPMLLHAPSSSIPTPGDFTRNVIVTAGKGGRVYFVPGDLVQDSHELGHAMWRKQIFEAGHDVTGCGITVTAAYYDTGANGRYVYVASAAHGDGDLHHGLVAVKLDDLNGETMLGARIIQFEGPDFVGAPGSPFVSSNGPNDGIVWLVDSHRLSKDDGDPSILRAWDAVTGQLLYHDVVGDGRKFVGLTVVNGKVFVPTAGVVCYGIN